MLCLLIAGMVSATTLRFSSEIFPIDKFRIISRRGGYNIIYDAYFRKGYLQVPDELKECIEKIYSELDGKNLAPFTFGIKDVKREPELNRRRENPKPIPIDLLNPGMFVAHAMKYMDASNLENEHAKINKLMNVLTMFDVEFYESERTTRKAFVYDAERQVFSITVGISRVQNILKDMKEQESIEKYDVRSWSFYSDLESFYWHIYNENGVLVPPEERYIFGSWNPLYYLAGYLNPRMHAILSVIGARQKVIRVRDGGKVQYYAELLSYEDVFPPHGMSIHGRIEDACRDKYCTIM